MVLTGVSPPTVINNIYSIAQEVIQVNLWYNIVMKIVIASDAYFPMTNGVAVFAHNLAEGLAKRGHEVLAIYPSFDGRKHKKKDRKTKVTNVCLKSMRFPFYPDQIEKIPEEKRVLYKNGLHVAINPYIQMKKVLESFQPDVIHLQTPGPVGIAARTYANKHNIPLVSTGHSYPDNFTGQFKILKPVKKPVDAVVKSYMNSFLKHSEYATMPTEMAIEDLVPKNRKRFKVPVEALSNGVDLSQFTPGEPTLKVLKKYKIDPSRPRVIYVGRVDPEKSIEIVVDAFFKSLEKVPNAEMLVVGDGTDKGRLEKKVKGQENNIRFLGKIMPPELQEVYRTGSVFATASETETQGIVLIEAAATGLPLIAVDAGAIREICQNKKNGFLCQPKDVEKIAEAMVKLLTDKKLREKYSENSLEISKKHDLNVTLKRFEEIYQKAIELSSLKS